MNKVFSFDAETNGLWGQAFAIGALVYDENGVEIGRFVGRCPIEGEVNSWVKGNVLPQMTKVVESHPDYDALLSDFAGFYLAYKEGANVIVHMGVPVESKLLSDMHARGLIGDWDGPYPLIDIAGNLLQIGEDPTSVDSFVERNELFIGEFEGGTHNPLYDAAAAAAAYRHLTSREEVSR